MSLTSTSIYAYYIDSGFASFLALTLSNVPSTILNNIFSAECYISLMVMFRCLKLQFQVTRCFVQFLNLK